MLDGPHHLETKQHVTTMLHQMQTSSFEQLAARQRHQWKIVNMTTTQSHILTHHEWETAKIGLDC
jgi:hypothetical protein